MRIGALLICITALAVGSAVAQPVATFQSDPRLDALIQKAQQAPPARQAKLLKQLATKARSQAKKTPNNVPTWQLLAWVSYQLQDYATFVRAQHQLHELGHARPGDMWAAAEWSFGMEDYVTTLEFVRYAERSEGPSFRSASSRRNAFLRLYEGDSALDAAADYLAAAPGDPQAAMLYAQTLSDLGAQEEAYMAFQSAKKVFPTVTELRWQIVRWAAGTGRWDDALNESARIWSDPSVAVRAKVAYVSQLLNEDPREEGMATLAVRWTEGLLRQDSANPAFWALRGDVARWLDDLSTADESWRRCIALPNGGQWPVHQQLLQLDLDRSDAGALMRDAAAAQADHPEHPFGPLFLGVAQSRNADLPAAYATLTEGVKRFGSDPSVREQYLMYLGEVCFRLGRTDEFHANFTEAIGLNPQNPTCLNNYAYFLALRKLKLGDAEGMAKKAVGLAPSEVNFWDTLAAVYAAQRKLPKAQEAIQRALDLGGTQSAAIVERAGDIHAAMGAHAEAKRWYEQAQFLGNTSSDLVRKLEQLPKP